MHNNVNSPLCFLVSFQICLSKIIFVITHTFEKCLVGGTSLYICLFLTALRSKHKHYRKNKCTMKNRTLNIKGCQMLNQEWHHRGSSYFEMLSILPPPILSIRTRESLEILVCTEFQVVNEKH